MRRFAQRFHLQAFLLAGLPGYLEVRIGWRRGLIELETETPETDPNHGCVDTS